MPWQLPRGWVRTAAGTGLIRPRWWKRTKRTSREMAARPFYWKRRGRTVPGSCPLRHQCTTVRRLYVQKDDRLAVIDAKNYLARPGPSCRTRAHCDRFLLCSSAFSCSPSHRRWRPRCLPARRHTQTHNAADSKHASFINSQHLQKCSSQLKTSV